MKEEAAACGLTIYDWNPVIENQIKGDHSDAFEETEATSDYMFSYTSGTTGDPKGVKLNHL